jgi:hypothetical protein
MHSQIALFREREREREDHIPQKIDFSLIQIKLFQR